MSAFVLLFGVTATLVGLILRADKWKNVVLAIGATAVVSVLLLNVPSTQMFFGPGSEWFWAMAQFYIIAGSLVFVARQIHIQRQANSLTGLLALGHRWESGQMRASRSAVCSGDPGDSKTIGDDEGAVCGFFEDLGIYVNQGIFDIATVWEIYSYWIEHYWPLMQPRVEEYRRIAHDNTMFSHFERLHTQIQAHSRKQGVPVLAKTDEQMKKFQRGERDLSSKIRIPFVTETPPSSASAAPEYVPPAADPAPAAQTVDGSAGGTSVS